MRVLLAIIILAALGWSGFWYFQATARDRALTDWLEQRRADGWIAEAADISVAGFPNRVDTTVQGLALADPDAGWSWHADALEILGLTYKPHHIIAALPGEQIVSTPYQTIRAESDLLRGSVQFRPTPRLELDHSTFEIENMRLSGDGGWTASIGKAIFATRQAAGQGTAPFSHDVSFDAERLTLPPEFTDRLHAGAMLPAEVGRLDLDATLTFDRPWDRPAVEAGNPALQVMTVRNVSVDWGDLDLSGSGTLTADADGYAEGRLDLRASNWRQMLDAAEQAGLVNSTVAGAARAGLSLIAGFGGGGDDIRVRLDFSGGMARLGPVPLGPAPILARRG